MDNKLEELIKKYVDGTFESKSSNYLLEGLLELVSKPSVFKYSSAASAIRNLKESTIFFNSPLKFNDIRDCNPKMLHLSTEYLISKATDLIKEQYPGKALMAIDKLLKSSNFQKMVLPKTRETATKQIINQVLVSCFTQNYDNELMWAHYANSHEGICIEYDSHKFLSYINSLSIKPVVLKVHYKESLKPVLMDGKDIRGALMEWLLNKSISYAYEKEIRFLFLNKKGVGNPVPIPKNVIKSIYLGNKIREIDRNDIVSYIKSEKLDINVYKMGLNDDLTLVADTNC